MTDCIQIQDLSKQYGKNEIVKSISFHVKQGEIFALLGPNGAGKSTTMNIVSTLLSKTKGKIIIDGLDLDTDKDEIKKKIGIVFQDDVLDSELTIYQNLWFRGGLYGLSNKQLSQQIDTIVQILSLQKIVFQTYKTCSGGQKRLAQLGRALLSNPKLLILDEPTTGLDPVTRQNVWNVLLNLKSQLQITIFFTTHYMEEASYADTICFLKNGSILLCEDRNDLKKRWTDKHKEPNLNDIYLQLLKGNEK